MLIVRPALPPLSLTVLSMVVVVAAPASAQELAPHRAVYSVTTLDHGKPSGEPPGTYA
jgi:hypothetical protein